MPDETPTPTRPPGAHPLAPLATPFVWACRRLPLPPTFFTLLSVPLVGLAFWALVTGRFLLALPLVFAAAGADAVDGAVARARNETSAAGGYLDSMLDRLVDFLVLLGILIAAGTTHAWIAGAVALFGMLTTSAAKWRYLQERPHEQLGWRDFSRTDRYVVILAGLLAASLLPHLQATVLFILLLALAIGGALSASANTMRAWRSLDQ